MNPLARLARFLFAGAAAGAIVVIASSACRAMPVDQYLKLRRQRGYDPRLSYAQVKADPSTFAGRPFEVRGIVEGFASRDQSISFLLTLPDHDSICLTAPPSDERTVTDSNRQSLRLLVRAEDNATSNLPALEVLAVANDAQVTAKEREAAAAGAAQGQAEAKAAAQRQAQQRRTQSMSRGYYVRRSSGASGGAGLSSLARRVLGPEAQQAYPAYQQFIYRCNRRLTAEELDRITVSVLYFSQQYKIDPRLVCAMIIAESDFDPRSTSRKGAMGLGQLMPDEARAMHLRNPYDPIENIQAAVGLLRGKLDRYRTELLPEGQYSLDQVMLALAAYNAGPGAVKKYGGIPPYRETQGYIKRIIKTYRELCGAG